MKDLFLCHSGVDKEFVRDIASDVEAEDWNGRPLSVFLDEWDITPGANIVVRLNEALSESRFVGLVLTPEMIGSDWCRAEFASVLYEDPTNRRERLIPLRLRDQHKTTGEQLVVPPFLGPLNYLDFRRRQEYKRQLGRLLAQLKGEAPSRGSRRRRGSQSAEQVARAFPPKRDAPDQVPETLVSNLLAIRSFPKTIWCVNTGLRTKRELPSGVDYPPFVVREGCIYAFSEPASGTLLGELATGSSARIATVEWRNDSARWRWYIELLNDVLRRHLRESGVGYDREHGRYYFLAKKENGVQIRVPGSRRPRTVVRKPDPDKGGYWVHQSARIRFETLGENVFLSIDPTYSFTKDGFTPVDKTVAGPMTMRWGGKERNGAILRHVLMWSHVLTKGRAEASIRAGDQELVVARLPATVRAPVSIVGDQVTIGSLLDSAKADQELEFVRNAEDGEGEEHDSTR